MRASVYCRISKDRVGAGLGVRSQEQDCRELAAALGATVVSVHTDNDISAYSGKPRPGYRSLLQEVTEGRVDVILVWHTDRLHRSPAELEEYIAACEARGVATHTVKAGKLDLATPSGRLVARQLGSVARYEVEHAMERMQRAKDRSAEAGLWKGGRRPFGYEKDGVTVREREAQALREAADQILAGEPVRAVGRSWNAQGLHTTTGKPWPLDGPRRVLLRPRNAGLMEHRGEIVGEANWPAVIEPEKWRAVVRVLTDPSRKSTNTTTAVRWLGSGLFRCDRCGTGMRVDRDRAGRPTYRCTNGTHVTRLVEHVDDFVSRVLVERLRRPDVAGLLGPEVPRVDIEALEAQARELTERKNQLAAVFAEGAIDAAQLAEGSRVLAHELQLVRDQVAATYSGSVLDGIGDKADPGGAWLEANLDRQRLVLNALMEVTLLRSGRGRPAGWRPGESYFRPETIRIDWRR